MESYSSLFWLAICSISGSIYNFSPKFIGQFLFKQETPCHLHNGYVFSFTHTILLWSVDSCKLMLNPYIYTELFKFIKCILSTIIWSNHLNLYVTLILNPFFKCFENTCHFRFLPHKVYLTKPTKIINEKYVILTTIEWFSLHWSTDININELQYCFCWKVFFMRKRLPGLLPELTYSTYFVFNFNKR